MVIPIEGATCERWGVMGRCDWANIFVWLIPNSKSMTYLKICLWALSKRISTTMVLVGGASAFN
jgi:hypothetical protein